jgi:hypothetical protein
MKSHTVVVFVTKDVIILEKVMRYCALLKVTLSVVNAGLSSFPVPPSGIALTVVVPNESEKTISSAINKGIAATLGIEYFIITDSTADTLYNLEFLRSTANSIPRVGIIHANKNEIPGTRQVNQVPILGSLITNQAFRAVGSFNPSIRDLALVASEWCSLASKRGWNSVLTKGLDQTLETPKGHLKTVLADMELLKATHEIEQRDSKLTAPNRDLSVPKVWEGPTHTKPWNYPVTVGIPHLGSNLRVLQLAIETWRKQTRKPFIQVVDTGSPIAMLNDLLNLESDDLEISVNRSRGFRGKWEGVALAYQQLFNSCRTPYLLLTHNDLIPISQTVLDEMMSLCTPRQPVVGYSKPQKEGTLGLHLTMLHIQTLDRVWLTWQHRWYRHNMALTDKPEGYSLEESFNKTLSLSGIKPLILGSGTTFRRQITPHFDHIGGLSNTLIYDRPHASEIGQIAEEVTTAAEERLRKWTS